MTVILSPMETSQGISSPEQQLGLANLEDSLILIRTGQQARHLLIEQNLLEPQDGIDDRRIHDLRSRYDSDDESPAYNALQTAEILARFPEPVLRSIVASGQQAFSELFEAALPKIERFSRNFDDHPTVGRDDVMQESYFKLYQIALGIPRTGVFMPYLRQSLHNVGLDLLRVDRKESMANHSRPLVQQDFRKGQATDKFALAENFHEEGRRRKLVDRTDAESAIVMHDTSSAEESLIQHSEAIRSQRLINTEAVDRLLDRISFFNPEKQAYAKSGVLNKRIFMAMLFPQIISGEVDDPVVKHEARGDGSDWELKVAHYAFDDETLAEITTAVRDRIVTDQAGTVIDEDFLQSEINKTLLNRVWQYRRRGRVALTNFLVDNGYASRTAEDDRPFTAEELLWAIEDSQ